MVHGYDSRERIVNFDFTCWKRRRNRNRKRNSSYDSYKTVRPTVAMTFEVISVQKLLKV
jgi:hypothetical protein